MNVRQRRSCEFPRKNATSSEPLHVGGTTCSNESKQRSELGPGGNARAIPLSCYAVWLSAELARRGSRVAEGVIALSDRAPLRGLTQSPRCASPASVKPAESKRD